MWSIINRLTISTNFTKRSFPIMEILNTETIIQCICFIHLYNESVYTLVESWTVLKFSFAYALMDTSLQLLITFSKKCVLPVKFIDNFASRDNLLYNILHVQQMFYQFTSDSYKKKNNSTRSSYYLLHNWIQCITNLKKSNKKKLYKISANHI